MAAAQEAQSATQGPAPPSKPPPQKASAFSGRGGFNPLRAFNPMVNLIRGSGAQSQAQSSVPLTPRAPQPASASTPNLPVVAKPPPTPPPAAGRSNSKQRPTPRKGQTPRDASPTLPSMSPSPSPRKPGMGSPRDIPPPEVCDSPVPSGRKDIRPPAGLVARSAPAAPGAPPGAPTRSASGGPEPAVNNQCREILAVQGNAVKLLSAIFEFTVTEEASVSILDQYPELAWLAHCMQRCPLPPCWTSIDGDAGGEAQYIDMENGITTDVQPLLEDFAELARLMLQWRQAPSTAPHVATELAQKHERHVEESARSRRVWSGPHTDEGTGMKFWHCEATGLSTWGDPGAAAEFLARVSERLRRALPKADETDSTQAVPGGVSDGASSARASSRASAREPSPFSQKKAPVKIAAMEADPAAGPDKPSFGDTGEMIKARAQEVRDMMSRISNNSLKKEEFAASKRIDVADVPTPARAEQSREPGPPAAKPKSSPRQPAARCPSPRSLAPARKAIHEAALSGWGAHGNQGVAGNRIYQEAAAEVRAPKGSWKPGACRPGPAARRRPDSSERLEPLESEKEKSPALTKRVSFLENDGVTTRPGSDSPVDNGVMFIDEAGATVGEPPNVADKSEASGEAGNDSKMPRAGTPARPRSRRGENGEPDPTSGSPRPRTPVPGTPRPRSSGKAPNTPRPCTPASTPGKRLAEVDGQDVATSPDVNASNSDDSSRCSSSGDAELVACDSPLGNTGTAKTICDVAIAAAVDLAFGNHAAGKSGCGSSADADATHASSRETPQVDDQASASDVDPSGKAEGHAHDISRPSTATAARPPTLGAAVSSTATAARPVTPGPDVAAMKKSFANTGLADTLGNTGAARQLCDDAIAAAVSSAVDACAFGDTGGSLLEDVDCGTMMTFGGTLHGTRGSKLGATLGATGDVPPVLPGEGMFEEMSAPTSPCKTEEHLLRDELAEDEFEESKDHVKECLAEDEFEDSKDHVKGCLAEDEFEDSKEPMSPSLMSICKPTTPSPTKRGVESSFQAESPSLIILEDTHWTACKSLTRVSSPPKSLTRVSSPPKSLTRVSSPPKSPCTPQSPPNRKKERPVRCGSPQPLSARGRERHAREMAALGLQVGAGSARGPRPRGRGVRHFAVAGGA